MPPSEAPTTVCTRVMPKARSASRALAAMSSIVSSGKRRR